ncbi:hypothetical protein HK405_004694 [Cladochytrium tenue]|nr:hypothetical protein HK405_004694 [Cladochytrium tenue]
MDGEERLQRRAMVTTSSEGIDETAAAFADDGEGLLGTAASPGAAKLGSLISLPAPVPTIETTELQNEHASALSPTPQESLPVLANQVSTEATAASRILLRPPDLEISGRRTSNSSSRRSRRSSAGVGGGGGGKEARESVAISPLMARASRLTLLTRSTPIPRWIDTAREVRFGLRVVQILLSSACLGCMVSVLSQADFHSVALATGGINFLLFTAITAEVVSGAWIAVYLFPIQLMITPHRHPRISRVETLLDLLLLAVWLGGATTLAVYGRACPSPFFGLSSADLQTYAVGDPAAASGDPARPRCIAWGACIGLCFAAAASFAVSAALGATDVRMQAAADPQPAQARKALLAGAKGAWAAAPAASRRGLRGVGGFLGRCCPCAAAGDAPTGATASPSGTRAGRRRTSAESDDELF